MTARVQLDPTMEAVLELLELAHGYTLLGSFVPMRKAALECGVSKDSTVWNCAHNALHRFQKMAKPKVDDYLLALAHAIEHVERGGDCTTFVSPPTKLFDAKRGY